MTSDLLLQLRNLAKLIADSHTLRNRKLFKPAINSIEISVDSVQLPTLTQYCSDAGFVFSEGLDSIVIDIQYLSQHMHIFLGIAELQLYCRQNYNAKVKTDLSSLFIIEENGTYLISENNALVESSSVGFNDVQYILLFYRFANKMREISNYVDEVTHTYVLFTSNKGVVKIALGEVDLTDTMDHIILLDRICCFEEEIKDGRKLDFIKSAIIAHIEYSEDRDIATIISRLGNIIEDSVRNHQLYMEEFSFEKFKTLWEKEKEKYFEKFRDSINKITAQMANLPIALIAFVITTNDKLTSSTIEGVFYSIFSVYVFATLWIQVLNLVELIGLTYKITYDSSRISNDYPSTFKLIQSESKEMKYKAISLSILSLVIIISFGVISSMVILTCIRSYCGT